MEGINIKFINQFRHTYNQYTDIEAQIEFTMEQILNLMKIEDEANFFGFPLDTTKGNHLTTMHLEKDKIYSFYLYPEDNFDEFVDLEKLNNCTTLKGLLSQLKTIDACLYILID